MALGRCRDWECGNPENIFAGCERKSSRSVLRGEWSLRRACHIDGSSAPSKSWIKGHSRLPEINPIAELPPHANKPRHRIAKRFAVRRDWGALDGRVRGELGIAARPLKFHTFNELHDAQKQIVI